VVSDYQINGVKIILVEESVDWPDYRVVVLKDQMISCYLRKPLHVVGNGVSSIRHLLLEKQERFAKDQRDTLINIDDPRIAKKLVRSNFTLETILSSGEIWQAYDISNLSVGGEAEDYTDRICAHWRDLCIKVVRDMGLIFCGVDLACVNIEDPNAAYSILEINASPSLDNYAASGQKQAIVVRQLYKKVFNESMQKGF
jgi:D-alanine-D-alanine ligase-like ATP-grasp enzyme